LTRHQPNEITACNASNPEHKRDRNEHEADPDRPKEKPIVASPSHHRWLIICDKRSDHGALQKKPRQEDKTGKAIHNRIGTGGKPCVTALRWLFDDYGPFRTGTSGN
jgi:hypothetical protein